MIPDLSPAELERLALLMEEMGEAIQVIGKIERHGYNSIHPNGGYNNRELLEKEMGHVFAAFELMCRKNDLDVELVGDHDLDKRKSVKQYLHQVENL